MRGAEEKGVQGGRNDGRGGRGVCTVVRGGGPESDALGNLRVGQARERAVCRVAIAHPGSRRDRGLWGSRCL